MNHKDLIIELPEAVDDRGSLCIAEGADMPFAIQRVFWLYGIGKDKTRGGHAHTSCEEVVIAVHGSFDMVVDDGKERRTVRMDSPRKGIYIRKNVWCELRNFSEGTICVVLASEPYNMDGYMKDYETFKKKINGGA